MNRLISTKLFRLLRDASQKDIDADAQVLENEYDKLVILLLTDTTLSSDKVTYRNILLNTRIRLSNLTGASGKKCAYLFT